MIALFDCRQGMVFTDAQAVQVIHNLPDRFCGGDPRRLAVPPPPSCVGGDPPPPANRQTVLYQQIKALIQRQAARPFAGQIKQRIAKGGH